MLKLFPALTKNDIRCVVMSENGADIKLLLLTALKLFPYNIECKNREEYKTIYKHYRQTIKHGTLEPLLVIKIICIKNTIPDFNTSRLSANIIGVHPTSPVSILKSCTCFSMSQNPSPSWHLFLSYDLIQINERKYN